MGLTWGFVHPDCRFPQRGEDILVTDIAQPQSSDASDLTTSCGSITLRVCSILSILLCQSLKEPERCSSQPAANAW